MSEKDEELRKLRKQLAHDQQEIARLTKLLDQIQQQLQDSIEGNKDLRSQLKELQQKLDLILLQIQKRNRKDFGNKTERHNPKPALETITSTSTRSKSGTTELPSKNGEKHILKQSIPIQPISHVVPAAECICPNCAVNTVFMRDEISYQIEKLSHSLVRLQHQQEVRACPKCKLYVVTAEKPCPPIPGSYVGPGLLAHVITAKYADGLPNFRLAKIFKREEAIIPRSTQSDWCIASALLLQPLYELLKREVLTSSIVQTDDSELKIQDRQHRKNMRKGKLTVYVGDSAHRATVFDFSPDKTFSRNIEFFREYANIVQADAANGFDALFKDSSRKEAGCNAHARRKFFDALPADPKNCTEILDIYGEMYDIEKKIRGSTDARKLAIRRQETKPQTRKLRRRLRKLQESLNPTHPLMDAVSYALKHWVALTRFLGNPNVEIDNNAAERCIKEFVLMRKNSLFAGSDDGGNAAAVHLSFMASCRRNQIDPIVYLTDVFTRINLMKTSQLEQLLPDRWVPLPKL